MISKNNEGVLYYSVRYKDAFGKTVQDSNWKTKKEVKYALDQFLLATQNDVVKLTVNQLYILYRTEQNYIIKIRSTDTYEKLYRVHIKPLLGAMIIDLISQCEIAQWQAYLVSKKFSNNYSSAIQQFFRTLINYGLKYKYIKVDPFKEKFVT